MNIAFYGSTNFSLEILKKLYEFHLAGRVKLHYVVSQPAKPFGRKRELKNNPVVEFCTQNNIQVFTPNRIKELLIGILANFSTDVSFVAAYGKILPESLLRTSKYGFLNFHGSNLPEYRGAAPVQMTILHQNIDAAGVTLIKMDKGMDTGEVIQNSKFKIQKEEFESLTAGELMGRLAGLASEMLVREFEYIFSPEKWELKEQDEIKASYCYVSDMAKENFKVNYADGVKLAHGKIMAANPDPIAWIEAELKGFKTIINLICSNISFRADIEPKGELSFHYLKQEKKLFLELKDGFVEIKEIQPQGRNVMKGFEFGNGLRANS